MIVIGDIIRDRRDLRLKRRMAAKIKRETCINRRHCPSRRCHRAIMFGKPLKRFPTEVQAIPERIRRFKRREYPQRMAVVIKAACPGHRLGERILTSVTKWRMA